MGKTIDIREPELESRAQAIADAIGQAAEEAAEKAASAWRESEQARHEAAKTLERQGREIGKWWNHAWRKDIQPALRKLWTRRTVAIGAMGAAVPASKQLIEDATAELGLRPRKNRHLGAFLAGIVIGALTGVLIAILTAPKPGSETREELVSKAREAADAAGEWIPVNVPSTNGNGGSVDAPKATEVESES